MNKLLLACLLSAATPSLAQEPGPLSVEQTPIADLIKVPAAKAALERLLPAITQYYDQVGAMTLVQLAPMSQGATDDAKLREIQAELDRIKPEE